MHHLAGHGCAGSALSICLARQLLLAVRPAATVFVVVQGACLRGLGCASSTHCLVRQLLLVLKITARHTPYCSGCLC